MRAPPVLLPLFYPQPSGCSLAGSGTRRYVGIVGAGIAGLACADALADNGVRATIYEAATPVGGRCFSLRNFFPGQVVERGGEFIDTPHKTMLRYARRFGLALEDVSKEPGDVFYHLGGQLIPEDVVVDEFRDFIQVMRLDVRRLSNETTALDHTDADVALDLTSLPRISTEPMAPVAPRARSRRRRSSPPTSQSTASSQMSRAASTSCTSSTPIGARSSPLSASPATSGTTCSTATIGSSPGLAAALPRPVELGYDAERSP